MSVLEVRNLKKSFDAHTVVLRGVDFSLEKGETIAIIGSSGSGKTTLLRCLNFLDTSPTRGSIAVNGETLFDAAGPQHAERAARSAASGCTSASCFRISICSRSTRPWQNVMLASRAAGQGAAGLQEPARSRSTQQIAAHGGGAAGAGGAEATRWTSTRTSSPAASSSVWPSPGRWPCSRTSSASTSPPPPWTRS